MVAEGKTVVLITCSIHSTEVASTFSAIEFAYRMATASDAKTREILENVIVILAPTINPDGIDIVHNWYHSTLGTPFEGTSPPELYQKYVGHDNNRDWYIFSQAETRAVVSGLHNQCARRSSMTFTRWAGRGRACLCRHGSIPSSPTSIR